MIFTQWHLHSHIRQTAPGGLFFLYLHTKDVIAIKADANGHFHLHLTRTHCDQGTEYLDLSPNNNYKRGSKSVPRKEGAKKHKCTNSCLLGTFFYLDKYLKVKTETVVRVIFLNRYIQQLFQHQPNWYHIKDGKEKWCMYKCMWRCGERDTDFEQKFW